MSGKLFDKYGAILAEDVEVLEACISVVAPLYDLRAVDVSEPRTVRVLEIGMHDGGTAKGIEAFLADRGWKLAYVGIDPDTGHTRPRYVPAGGREIIGDSAEVFHLVDGEFDLVWVDGCHCVNHVILDTVHYSPRVKVGGFMLFHDVNPAGQGTEHQYHGPETPSFGLANDEAHRAIGWPFAGWELCMERWPTDVHNCGMRAFRRKLAP